MGEDRILVNDIKAIYAAEFEEYKAMFENMDADFDRIRRAHEETRKDLITRWSAYRSVESVIDILDLHGFLNQD
ncbi:MAG: hypothetical protein ABIH41_03580 [Nanoarchaeota archaeon]